MKVLAKTDKGTYIIEVTAPEFEIVKHKTEKGKFRQLTDAEWLKLARPDNPLSSHSVTDVWENYSDKDLCSASWVMDQRTYQHLRGWRYADGDQMIESDRPAMPLSLFGIPIEIVNYNEAVLGLRLDQTNHGEEQENDPLHRT